MKKLYAVLSFLMVTVVVTAQTKTFVPNAASPDGSFSWANGQNWSPTGAPGANNLVVFSSGGAFVVANVPTITLNRITVNGNTQVVLRGLGAIQRTITLNDVNNANELIVDGTSALSTGANLNLNLPTNSDADIKGTLTITTGQSFTMGNGNTLVNVTGKVINQGEFLGGTTQRLVFAAGSSFDHSRNAGTIPNANWAAASTINILGVTTQAPGNVDQEFGNFTWNSATQTGAVSLLSELASIQGDFTISSTGTGELRLKSTILDPGGNATEVNGDFNLSGGTLVLVQSSGTQNLIVNGDFNMTGGVLRKRGGGLTQANVEFGGTVEQKFTKTGGSILDAVNFSIESNAKVEFGNSVLTSSGSFDVKDGGRLIVSHPAGLSSVGATGPIQTTTRIYRSTADYEFRGPVTGVFNTRDVDFFGNPAGVTNPTVVRALIINNTTTGVTTLSQPININQVNYPGQDPADLQLVSGALKTSAANILTLGAGAVASGVLDVNGNYVENEYNLTSFIDGPIRKTGNTRFIFPVGKVGSGLHSIGITAPPSGGSAGTSFTAEYFRINAASLGANLAPTLQKVSGCEYWSLERSGTSAVRVILSWQANSGCGGQYVTDPLTLTVARFDQATDTWMNEGNTTGSRTGTIAAGTITSGSSNPGWVNTYGFFALGTTSATANPLPVVFGDVKAFEKNNGVQVDWSNLTEADVAEYSVERSANGRDFGSIATQLPTSNLNDRADYSAFDANPVPGTNYYRIRAIEVTGKEVYSKILAVTIGRDASGLRLYPNPVTDKQVTINLANLKRGAYDLRVVSVSGQDIFRKTIQNQSSNFTQTLNLPPSVKPGVYSMIITADNFRETRTFIVQ